MPERPALSHFQTDHSISRSQRAGLDSARLSGDLVSSFVIVYRLLNPWSFVAFKMGRLRGVWNPWASSHQAPDDSRPARLMCGAAATSGFPMKIFVKQDEVFPVRIRGVPWVFAMARPVALIVRQKETDQPADNFVGHLL